jgi:ketosteroid isomerase-like protein
VSAENLQVVRDVYAAFARNDIPAVLVALDENIEWTTSMLLRSGATYRGHEGVEKLLGALGEVWQEMSAEPEEFIDGGDTIVVVVRERATTSSGSTDTVAVHLWRMRSGKAIAFTEYIDTARTVRSLS